MKKIIFLIVAIPVVYVLYSNRLQQPRNIKLAEKFANQIAPYVQSMESFEGVQIGAGTGYGGVILIVGAVSDDNSLLLLKNLVQAHNPTIDVLWKVTIRPDILQILNPTPEMRPNGNQSVPNK